MRVRLVQALVASMKGRPPPRPNWKSERSGKGPAFDGGGTFAAGQLDGRTDQRMANPLAALPSPDE